MKYPSSFKQAYYIKYILRIPAFLRNTYNDKFGRKSLKNAIKIYGIMIYFQWETEQKGVNYV
jgi:hypothetical protein